MATLLHQVTLPFITNRPEDVSINTFWSTGAGGATQANAFNARLEDFYNAEVTAEDQTVAQLISPSVSRALNCEILVYDLADPEPRAPIVAPYLFQLGNTPSETGLPNEVALCMSFAAQPVSGVNAGRTRGRIYLGPLANYAVTPTPANGQARPNDGALETIAAAGYALAVASDSDATWVVRSRAQAANYQVVQGWVDNAWDTQRRRGLEATSRTLFAPYDT